MCYETNNTWKVFVNGKVDATLNEYFFLLEIPIYLLNQSFAFK